MAEFRRYQIELDSSAVTTSRKGTLDPIGYDAATAREQSDASASSTKRNAVANRQAALSSMAQAPLKNVAMMCFMMWMSGSQLHLFSIMTTASGFYQPLSAIIKSGEVFPNDPEGELDTLTPRLIYCAINLAGLAFAVYRINLMGLIPTHLTDWAGTLAAPVISHRAVPQLW